MIGKISLRSIRISLFLILNTFFIYKNSYVGEQFSFLLFVAVVLKLLQKYNDFLNYDDCIGKISSISIRKNSNVLETPIFGSMKMNFFFKTLDLCKHYFAVCLFNCKV